MNLVKLKASEIKEWANKNLSNINDDFDYYGVNTYFFESIIKAEDSSIYNVVMKNNEIFDIFFISDFHGIPVIYPHWYNCSNDKELLLLFETYPNSIINLGEYPQFDLDESEIVLLDLNKNDATYCLSSCYNFVAKKINQFILRDKFEELFFVKEFSMSEIVFEYINLKTLNLYLNKTKIDLFEVPFWRKKHGMHSFCGFHYFSNEEIWRELYNNDEQGSKYLVALYNEKIVGIIKVDFYYGKYQAIEYIDVRIDFKNHGLAKKMIQELSNFLDYKMPLIISEESDEGKKCHVFNMFKTYIKNNKVFKSSEYRIY